MICSPIGKPSLLNPAGTVAAGCPVKLKGKVKASHLNGGTMLLSIFSGPCTWSWNGGTASVGVSNRS